MKIEYSKLLDWLMWLAIALSGAEKLISYFEQRLFQPHIYEGNDLATLVFNMVGLESGHLLLFVETVILALFLRWITQTALKHLILTVTEHTTHAVRTINLILLKFVQLFFLAPFSYIIVCTTWVLINNIAVLMQVIAQA